MRPRPRTPTSRVISAGLSFEAPGAIGIGLREYLVVHGLETLTERGAPELLHRPAQTYIGPGVGNWTQASD